jgi:hypothetical protein
MMIDDLFDASGVNLLFVYCFYIVLGKWLVHLYNADIAEDCYWIHVLMQE